MRHPFWLINSSMLMLFIAVLGYVFLTKKRVPALVDFEPEYVQPLKETTPVIDLTKITNNDLFGTSGTTGPAKPSTKSLIKPMPQPPVAIAPKPLAKPVLQFLEPLTITLKGIMIVGDEKNNVAIIEDSKTSKAQNYKVGDKIQDGLLMRILKHKIILVRSNGQQETLFINQKDAELEKSLRDRASWSDVVRKDSDTSYTIDPYMFVLRVRNLSQFIDMLNMSTVYKQGKSIGCRLGAIESDSLGVALGLMQGDIITTVNGISANSTDNRMKIYQTVTLTDTSTVQVDIVRGDATITFNYRISSLPITTGTSSLGQPAKSEREIRIEKRQIFEEQNKLAPTLKNLQVQEKKEMLSHGHTPRAQNRRNKGVLSHTVLSERIPYDVHG